jgi:hypothetical protein
VDGETVHRLDDLLRVGESIAKSLEKIANPLGVAEVHTCVPWTISTPFGVKEAWVDPDNQTHWLNPGAEGQPHWAPLYLRGR